MNKIFEKRHDISGCDDIDTSVPVLILGGKENSLSLTRSLGKAGIRVSVSGPGDCWGLTSKFSSKSYPVPAQVESKHYWRGLLLNEDPVISQPHVILPCCDDSIEFLAAHENQLRRRHIFERGTAAQKLALLDKRQTLELAAAAGVGTPNFWPVSNASDIDHILKECRFPLIIKPLNTFKFAKTFGTKFFIVESGPEDLLEKVHLANDHGFEVLIVELIPGHDDLLSSYYTYIDDDGKGLFHFTKRIFRRYPMNQGGATYHATEWLPETAEEGLKFFRNTGFRGLGNIEFKRDPRDQKLKIIEVNARFTAAQELVVRSGVPIDLVVYCHLTGQPIPLFAPYERNMRFWYPLRDFLSYLQLRRKGQLSFLDWMKSLDFRRHVSLLFNLSDLRPALGAVRSIFRKIVLKLTERVFGAKNEPGHPHTS